MPYMLTAITRSLSPAMNACRLAYLPRSHIDIPKATEQHRRGEACLRGPGVSASTRGSCETQGCGGCQSLEVPADEPRGANLLTIGDTALVQACFPGTARTVERLGWKIRTLDISELMKAEAALTCSSIIFE